jgi:hypothetical protein
MTLPTLTINPDGTMADANAAALDLLRVSLEQLRKLPSGAFSAEPSDPAAGEAFRKEWEREGTPDIAGEGTLRRPDGTSVRVKFGITPLEDGRFLAILEEVEAEHDAPALLYTAGQVLAEWRAAERRLAAIVEGSPEWTAVSDEIEVFRRRYHALFDRRAGTT